MDLKTVVKEKGWGSTLTFERKDIQWDKMDRYVEDFKHDLDLHAYGKALVLYDVDVDGLVSGYMMEDFLTRCNIQVFRHMNTDKTHGLAEMSAIIETLNTHNIKLMIIPDAATNDIEQLKQLEDLGITVYVLDHHDIEGELLDTAHIKVLNITEREDLPKLSAGGVVFEFLSRVNTSFNMNLDSYENIVGLSVISDVCDMTDSSNRYYVNKLYTNFEKYLFFTMFDFYGSFRSLMAFKVVPYLNALIRMNKGDVAMDVITNMNNERVLRRHMLSDTHGTGAIRRKQKMTMKRIEESGKMIVLDGITIHLRKGFDYRTVGGLFANQLVERYNQGCVVLGVHPETKEVKGSFRGINFDNELLKRYGFKCLGHDLACGVFGNEESIRNITQHFEILEHEKIDFERAEFDIEADVKRMLKNPDVVSVALFNEYTGKGVPQISLKLTGYTETPYIEDMGTFRRIMFPTCRIIDFTGREEDEYIVTPAYNDTNNSFDLLRA